MFSDLSRSYCRRNGKVARAVMICSSPALANELEKKTTDWRSQVEWADHIKYIAVNKRAAGAVAGTGGRRQGEHE